MGYLCIENHTVQSGIIMATTSAPFEKTAILEALRTRQRELRQYGVRRLGLFGSFVRNEAGPDSDIDLLVEFEPGEATFRHFMELCFFLESLFEGRKVDVVSKGGLSRFIGPTILKEVEYAFT